MAKNKSPNARNRKSDQEEKAKLYVVERLGGDLYLAKCDTRSAFSKSVKVEKHTAKSLRVGDIVRSSLSARDASGSVMDVEHIGHISDKDMINYITALENEFSIVYDKKTGLRSAFSQAALDEAKNVFVPKFEDLEGFEDLRDIPLITIDPRTAKDFDDAVYATPRAGGGFHLITAIAGVSNYVTPGSALDKEAMNRGVTKYLPGIALHMLPEELSENVCSLVPSKERLCMAYHVDIDAKGNIVGGYVKPAMMKSVARLHYEQAQKAFDGDTDEVTANLTDYIKMLYAASDVMELAKEKREVLNIDKAEYEIIFDKEGNPVDIALYPKYGSNKVIENFALATNNWTGMVLAENGLGIYRVHQRPEKITELVATLNRYGVKLGGKQGNIKVEDIKTPKVFNEAIDAMKQIVDGPELEEFKVSVLCSMKKAFYSNEELIHFGLQLNHYTHTTSPIRRAPDILATRMLTEQFNLAGKGITDEEKYYLPVLVEHLSDMEKQAERAEKDAFERFTAKIFEKRIGEEFNAEVRHISHRGMLIMLDEKGTEGVVHLRDNNDNFKIVEEKGVKFIKTENSEKEKLSRGSMVKVIVRSAQAANGRIICEMPANDNQEKLSVESKVEYNAHGRKKHRRTNNNVRFSV